MDQRPYYVTTPIYYVNDRPHIGHCYTTVLADALARAARLMGRETFFLTGTDEHAEKVVESAAARNLTPIEWADQNAAAFQQAFEAIGCSHDDFVRTTEERHKSKVRGYIERLKEKGDIYLGDYEGWWDASQEEYVTETIARENEFLSPVTKKPLVKRTEHNYFFRLSAYEERLLAHMEANPDFVRPAGRRNEVLGRLRQGLQDVPISRAVVAGDAASAWGILMPGDEGHRIYVWIDALFNYLSTIDTEERRKFWPATAHVIGKDILWFHTVIWPCMLMALGEELYGSVYAHSYWVREGQKMSKSLGNFVDIDTLERYIAKFGRDAVRWYLLAEGPSGTSDADFAHTKFVEVYNSDLANGLGNASSRVGNMIGKYFDGQLPDPKGVTEYAGRDWPAITARVVTAWTEAIEQLDLGTAFEQAKSLVGEVDAFVHETAPFKLIKDEAKRDDVGAILYHSVEALRIAALLLSPALPGKCAEVAQRLGVGDDAQDLPFDQRTQWGQSKPGAQVTKGDALFPRADAAEEV